MGARGPGAKARPKLEADAAGDAAPAPSLWESKPTRAARLIAWIEANVKITRGLKKDRGQLIVLRPYQKEWLEGIYREDENGARVVRTAILTMARKNGKSALISALAIAHLIGPEREPRGEIVIGATDRDQAGVVFGEVEAMLNASPWLRAQVNIQTSAKIVTSYLDGSELKALSSDAKKAHGLNPTLVILDELAQWGEGIGIRLYNALTTAGGAREDPMTIVISTQAENDKAKMSELIDRGRNAMDGTIADPSWWCKVYETPEEFDPFDEAGWALSNPALGDFRTLKDMRLMAEMARTMPTERAKFENLYLNRRVSADERWIDKPTWMACHESALDPEALMGNVCYGGLDLASVSDLTSFSLFFPGNGALLSWSWCPEERIRERTERVGHYAAWVADGWLETTPGKAISRPRLAHRLAELNARYQPKKIAFDRHGMLELAQVLEDEGIQLPLVEWGQGFVSMSPAMKATETRVLNRELRHNNPVLTWAVSNVVVARDDAGNIKPSKMRAREKIDPIVAGIMAVGVAAQDMAVPADRAFRGDDVDAVFADAA